MVTVADVSDELQDSSVPSQERLLDAEEIERVVASGMLKRPTAIMHLDALAKRLRKEAEALKRVENSSRNSTTDAMDAENDEIQQDGATVAAWSLPASVAATNNAQAPAVTTIPTVTKATSVKPTLHPIIPNSAKYVPIDRFSFDAGGYNAPFVTVYIDLPGVGSIKRDLINCKFHKDSFDLVVNELKGKSYRLFKDSLEKDIDVGKCKIVVKSDKIIIKLAKVKGEYGSYDYWSKLTDTKKSTNGKASKDNPTAGIMDLMKQMYDEGDDNMRKVIGETMMKQQRGELGKPDPMAGFDDMKDI